MKTTHLDVGVFEMMLSKAKELAKKAKVGSMGSLSDYLNPKDACAILRIELRTLQSLRQSGKLPYSQIGNKIYYHQDDIAKLLKKQTSN